MATAWWAPGNGGDDANDGLSKAEAKETWSAAATVAGLDGTVILKDGTNTLTAASSFNITQSVTLQAETPRGATLLPHASETGRLVRINSGVGPSKLCFVDLILDGNDQVTNIFSQQADTTSPADPMQVVNCVIKGMNKSGASYISNISRYRDKIQWINCEWQGELGLSGLITTQAGRYAEDTLHVRNLDLNGVVFPAGSGIELIDVTKYGGAAGNVNVIVDGVKGRIQCDNGGKMIEVDGADFVSVSNCDVEFYHTAPLTPNSSTAVVLYGNVTEPLQECHVDGNIIKDNSDHGGYQIQIGQPSQESYVNGTPTADGNVCTGVDDDGSTTPHGIQLGMSTNGHMNGNIVRHNFVGIIGAETTYFEAIGNLVVDCYGPSLYMKGNHDGLFRSNVAVVSTKFTQRTRCIMEATAQAQFNLAGTFRDNLVVVQDPAQIFALAGNKTASDVATFTHNTYLLPDTTDLSTANLFMIDGTLVNYATWVATHTTDEVVLLPQSEIDQIVSGYQETAGIAAEGGGAGSGGFRLSL